MNTKSLTLLSTATAAFLACTSALVSAADVNGKWGWLNEGGFGGSFEATLTLKQDGTAVTGTYNGGFGGEASIEDGKLDGDTLTFETSRSFGDRTFVTAFKGAVSGDAIKGTIEMGGGDNSRSVEWNAYRLPEVDPTGLYKWTRPGRNGGPERNNWVKLSLDKGKLKGTYITDRGQVALKEPAITEKEIAFKVERGWRDRTFTTAYKATLKDGNLVGTITTNRGDGEQTSEWTAAKDVAKVEPAGDWTWTTRRRNGEESESSLTLKLEDGKLTGSLDSRDQTTAITDAKTSGDEISFVVTRDFNGQSFNSNYAAKIDGDALKGTVTMGSEDRQWTRSWQAARKLPKGDPSGTWSWSTRRGRGGDATDSKLVVALADGNVTGSLNTGGSEAALTGAKVDGNTISFTSEQTLGDQTLSAHYTGIVRGDAIVGTIQYGENTGPDAWQWKWEAKRAAATGD